MIRETDLAGPWAVAIDGGTTNTRARLFRGSSLVATASQPVGARDSVFTGGVGSLAAAVGLAIRDVLGQGGIDPTAGPRPPVVAAGMLTADIGLFAVPHVPASAGLDELAAASVSRTLPDVYPDPILFIPGVRTPAGSGEGGWMLADLMRGEECETLGALLAEPLAPLPTAFLWPGSHTKLVEVDAKGRIARSHTTMAGEMLEALSRHTILAASLPGSLPDEPDPDALRLGSRTVAEVGLGRAAFLVRIAAVTGALDVAQRSAFWLGALLGQDAGHLAAHPIAAEAPTLLVGGRQPLRRWYAELLDGLLPGRVRTLDDRVTRDASALAALEIARRHRGGL
ncbi:2-dehydro-3-deoxygalactonokinase [Isosphaeraceae bacterium EP7]